MRFNHAWNYDHLRWHSWHHRRRFDPPPSEKPTRQQQRVPKLRISFGLFDCITQFDVPSRSHVARLPHGRFALNNFDFGEIPIRFLLRNFRWAIDFALELFVVASFKLERNKTKRMLIADCNFSTIKFCQIVAIVTGWCRTTGFVLTALCECVLALDVAWHFIATTQQLANVYLFLRFDVLSSGNNDEIINAVATIVSRSSRSRLMDNESWKSSERIVSLLLRSVRHSRSDLCGSLHAHNPVQFNAELIVFSKPPSECFIIHIVPIC